MTIEDRLQALQNSVEAMQKTIDHFTAHIEAQSRRKEYVYREVWIESGLASDTLQRELMLDWECLGIVGHGQKTVIYFRQDHARHSFVHVDKAG